MVYRASKFGKPIKKERVTMTERETYYDSVIRRIGGPTTSFESITHDMNEMYKLKNADYGSSFSDSYKKLGYTSAISRILDKTNRLVSFAENKSYNVEDETVEDTLLDLANYAVMTLMEIKGERDDERTN